MDKLRIDRRLSARALTLDMVIDPGQKAAIEHARSIDMPALHAILALLPRVEMLQRDAFLRQFQQFVPRLEALHKETETDFVKTKSQGRPDLPKEFTALTTDMIAAVEKLGIALALPAKHGNPFVDQLMTMKGLAWTARAAGGDISVVMTKAMAFTQTLSPEEFRKYVTAVSYAETGWQALKQVEAGTALPSVITDAMAKADQTFFDPNFIALRERIINQLVTAQKLEMTANDWTKGSLPKLDDLGAVADAALKVAQDREWDQLAAAKRDLAVQLGLLPPAMVLAAGGMIAISRRARAGAVCPVPGIFSARQSNLSRASPEDFHPAVNGVVDFTHRHAGSY